MTHWCQKNELKNLIWLDLIQCVSDIWSTMCTYDGWMDGWVWVCAVDVCMNDLDEKF
jgi:hypothetical protein